MLEALIVFALSSQVGVSDQSVKQPETSSSAAPINSARAAAVANKMRVKIPPRFKVQPEYIRPEEARIRGEFGEVTLSAIIQSDGKVVEPEVKVSSRSVLIDAAALTAVPAMLFDPARDAQGTPVSVMTNISLEYSHADFNGPRSIARYRCDQSVRDYDWWHRTWPAEKQDRVFKTLRGFVFVADLRAGKSGGLDFDTEWASAIEACRNRPNKLMIDMLNPHGPLIRDMVSKR